MVSAWIRDILINEIRQTCNYLGSTVPIMVYSTDYFNNGRCAEGAGRCCSRYQHQVTLPMAAASRISSWRLTGYPKGSSWPAALWRYPLRSCGTSGDDLSVMLTRTRGDITSWLGRYRRLTWKLLVVYYLYVMIPEVWIKLPKSLPLNPFETIVPMLEELIVTS